MDWIKIMCNLLDHRKIKMIRKGPEGNLLILFWVLLLLEAGKCNRGGYLMISASMPYTPETLSTVTDFPLATVQLALETFSSLDMIDQQDGAVCIKNWAKYQSEDKLEMYRENARKRQQVHRQNEREKLNALNPAPLLTQDHVSRDSNVTMSRDVTLENRTDQIKAEQTTTEDILLLLSGTPLSKIKKHELQALVNRHGLERLALVADVAGESWRRDPVEKHNPGGYLQSLCTSLVVPEWYVPISERKTRDEALQLRKEKAETEQAAIKAQEEDLTNARNALWDSLTEEQREEYRLAAIADVAPEIAPAMDVRNVLAKLLAWETLRGGSSAGCST